MASSEAEILEQPSPVNSLEILGTTSEMFFGDLGQFTGIAALSFAGYYAVQFLLGMIFAGQYPSLAETATYTSAQGLGTIMLGVLSVLRYVAWALAASAAVVLATSLRFDRPLSVLRCYSIALHRADRVILIGMSVGFLWAVMQLPRFSRWIADARQFGGPKILPAAPEFFLTWFLFPTILAFLAMTAGFTIVAVVVEDRPLGEAIARSLRAAQGHRLGVSLGLLAIVLPSIAASLMVTMLLNAPGQESFAHLASALVEVMLASAPTIYFTLLYQAIVAREEGMRLPAFLAEVPAIEEADLVGEPAPSVRQPSAAPRPVRPASIPKTDRKAPTVSKDDKGRWVMESITADDAALDLLGMKKTPTRQRPAESPPVPPVKEVKVEVPPVEEVKVEVLPVEEVKVEVLPVEEVKVEVLPGEEVKVEVPPVEEVKVEVPPGEEVKVEVPPGEEVKVEVPPVEEVKVEIPPVEQVKVEVLPVEEVKVEVLPVEDVKVVPPVEEVKAEAAPVAAPERPTPEKRKPERVHPRAPKAPESDINSFYERMGIQAPSQPPPPPRQPSRPRRRHWDEEIAEPTPAKEDAAAAAPPETPAAPTPASEAPPADEVPPLPPPRKEAPRRRRFSWDEELPEEPRE